MFICEASTQINEAARAIRDDVGDLRGSCNAIVLSFERLFLLRGPKSPLLRLSMGEKLEVEA